MAFCFWFIDAEEEGAEEGEGGDEGGEEEEGGDDDEDDDDDDEEEEEEEDEEEPVDPLDTLRERCASSIKCQKAMARFEECESRVKSKSNTEEKCTEEILDFFHCQDYCMAKDLFNQLKWWGNLILYIARATLCHAINLLGYFYVIRTNTYCK